MEKKNGQRRFIYALPSENGFLLSDPADIRRRAFLFLNQNLYSSELDSGSCVESVFFESLPKVSVEANVELSGVLTLGELFKALQSKESLRAFWLELGEDLLEVLRASFLEGRLPLICRRAVITLIPKTLLTLRTGALSRFFAVTTNCFPSFWLIDWLDVLYPR